VACIDEYARNMTFRITCGFAFTKADETSRNCRIPAAKNLKEIEYEYESISHRNNPKVHFEHDFKVFNVFAKIKQDK